MQGLVAGRDSRDVLWHKKLLLWFQDEVAALKKLSITEVGYGIPLQVRVHARYLRFRVTERPVSRIYNHPNRTFGGDFDNPDVRLKLYPDT